MKTLLMTFSFLMCLLALVMPVCLAQNDPAATKPALTKSDIRKLVERLDQTMQKSYVFPEKGRLMGAYIQSQYKKGAYDHLTDPNALGIQLDKDLQLAQPDLHMHVGYHPQMAKELETPHLPGNDSQEKQEREWELAHERENNFAFKKVEILSGNVGYVRIDGFVPFIQEAKPTLAAAFGFLKNTRAIILDLQYNGGGYADMVTQMESYFFTQKTRTNDIIDPLQNKTFERYADPTAAGGLTLPMPMYILTSKWTASGAEDFSYAMQSAKRAVLVGDITAGAANMPRPYSLGQGFVANIPGARPYNIHTKTNWEGTGIKPDVAVPTEQALSKAQAVCFSDLMAKTTDEGEKKKLQWQLNSLKALEQSTKLNPAILSQYTGTYQGDLYFYVKQDQLYCRNAERGNRLFELKPISTTLFVLDENVQVEFEKNSTGAYSILKMHWQDGNISQKSKI